MSFTRSPQFQRVWLEAGGSRSLCYPRLPREDESAGARWLRRPPCRGMRERARWAEPRGRRGVLGGEWCAGRSAGRSAGRNAGVRAVAAGPPFAPRRGPGVLRGEAGGHGFPAGSGGRDPRGARRCPGPLGLRRRGGGVRRCRPRGTAAPCPTRSRAAAAAGTIRTRSG